MYIWPLHQAFSASFALQPRPPPHDGRSQAAGAADSLADPSLVATVLAPTNDAFTALLAGLGITAEDALSAQYLPILQTVGCCRLLPPAAAAAAAAWETQGHRSAHSLTRCPAAVVAAPVSCTRPCGLLINCPALPCPAPRVLPADPQLPHHPRCRLHVQPADRRPGAAHPG
jgi:hypothetical protein